METNDKGQVYNHNENCWQHPKLTRQKDEHKKPSNKKPKAPKKKPAKKTSTKKSK